MSKDYQAVKGNDQGDEDKPSAVPSANEAPKRSQYVDAAPSLPRCHYVGTMASDTTDTAAGLKALDCEEGFVGYITPYFADALLRAVNSNAALMAATRAALDYLTEGPDSENPPPSLVIGQLRAALEGTQDAWCEHCDGTFSIAADIDPDFFTTCPDCEKAGHEGGICRACQLDANAALAAMENNSRTEDCKT